MFGIFGCDGVYMVNFWLLYSDFVLLYVVVVFRFYLNYDGVGGKFGDMSVGVMVSS